MFNTRTKNVCMTRLKDLYVSRQYTGSLYHSSGVLARQTEKLAKDIWAPSGLHPSHGHLLLAVLCTEYRFPTIFSRNLSLSISTINRLLTKLEKDGYVMRSYYNHCTLVSATQKAWELMPVLEACQKAFTNRCDELLGKEETARLAASMCKAADKLTAGEGRA
jgi:DNA-binding MarR family transcriptional regulator